MGSDEKKRPLTDRIRDLFDEIVGTIEAALNPPQPVPIPVRRPKPRRR